MARSPMTTPFVARSAQVAALIQAVGRAAAGEPGAVVLGADAGVGKSRLLRHMTELARATGATTVTTHCVDLGEVGLPYLPFAEALSALRGSAPVDEVLGSRPELARLLPSGGAAVPADEQTLRLQLFDGIAAVLGSVGRPGAPLVLVLEDLHWADSSTRDVLRYLIARMRREHLLLVASYRTDDLHRLHPLRSTLAELWRHPRVERVDLAPFTDDELREFTSAVLGRTLPEALQRRIAERSEGNAYFAEELAERGADATEVPWTLADVLRSRLEHLHPGVQRLASVASVAGRRVAEPLLRAVVSADGDPALAGRGLDDALREAVAHHVLMGEDGRIAFRHALLAEVVYADLLPGEQAALHRSYLEAMAADPSLAAAPTVAAHALRANDLPAALRASHAAALDAACLLAPSEELRHLETVLRLWATVPGADQLVGEDEVRVLTRAASAAARAGEPQRAVALARDAVDRAASDTARQARLRGRLARYLLSADQDRAALVEATRALADLPGDASDEHRAWALATHAHAAMWNDLDDEATVSGAAAVELARSAGVPAAEADALATLAVLVVDDPDHAAGLLATAVSRAKDAGDVTTEQRCTHNLATTLYYAGRLDEAAEVIEAGLERTRATGLTWSDFGLSQAFFEQLVRYCRGDLSERPVEPIPDSVVELYAAVRMYSAVARGDDVLAGRVPDGPAVWSPDGQVALIRGGCTIDALTWAGEHAAAVTMATDLIDHLGRAWDDYFLGAIWLAALGIAALADAADLDPGSTEVRAGRVATGTALLDRAMASAERGRPRGGRLGPEGRGWLARARSEHSRLTGENDPALWQASVEEFGYGYRYEEARSRWRWAEALLSAGDREPAQAQASAAAEMAAEIGAAPLSAAVLALGRRGRLDLPGLRRSSQELLTAREAEVLALVAEGLSNRQIGERLFISGKTVSVHVSNLLAKLSVSGRAQAVSVAHRQGLLGVGAEAGAGARRGNHPVRSSS